MAKIVLISCVKRKLKGATSVPSKDLYTSPLFKKAWAYAKSEDLDFMMWCTSRIQKPEVDWNAIERELTEKIGTIDNFNMLGFDQVEFLVRGGKFSCTSGGNRRQQKTNCSMKHSL